MSDPESLPERRRTSDVATSALISSAPDVNAIFQTLVEKFLSLPGRLGAVFAWILSNIWVIAAIGVPAMLAAAPLLDKKYQGEASIRAHELEMFKLQTQVEIQKLDRTLLGEGAARTLELISQKLDQQAEQTTKIQMDVQRLSADLQEVQRSQAKTDKRVGAIAANQTRLRDSFPSQ